jgi:hypothetical protein
MKNLVQTTYGQKYSIGYIKLSDLYLSIINA